jgi:Ca-activated chloride channel homolog
MVLEKPRKRAEAVIMFLSGKLLVWCWLAVVVGIVWLGIPAAQAQGDSSDVHIQPRVPRSLVSSTADRELNTHTQAIRKNVELVLVPVTITDPMDRVVVGLGPNNFQVFEGKQPQEIKHFSSEDAPVSLGIILDVSGSMASKIERAREAVVDLLKASNPQDEFFLITFSDAPQLVQDFTQKIEEAQAKLLFATPKGQTALLDAIYLGIDKMKEAKYSRKALLVISDGGDNHSLYTENEVKSVVKEADVLLYSVGIFDHEFRTLEERLGPLLLSEISDVTGGRCYTVDSPNDLPLITERIGAELRNQYVLGYRPTANDDGKWRKIKVNLTYLPKGLPPLRVRAKSGYYAPSR